MLQENTFLNNFSEYLISKKKLEKMSYYKMLYNGVGPLLNSPIRFVQINLSPYLPIGVASSLRICWPAGARHQWNQGSVEVLSGAVLQLPRIVGTHWAPEPVRTVRKRLVFYSAFIHHYTVSCLLVSNASLLWGSVNQHYFTGYSFLDIPTRQKGPNVFLSNGIIGWLGKWNWN